LQELLPPPSLAWKDLLLLLPVPASEASQLSFSEETRCVVAVGCGLWAVGCSRTETALARKKKAPKIGKQ
jgi:hypothetical protein